MDRRPWHALDVDAVVAALETSADAGLDHDEARVRLARHGPNVIGSDDGHGWVARLLAQFTDVLVWVLLVAAAISGALLDEWIDAGVIVAIVFLNAVLGFVQESRAERALSRLQELASPEAIVVRAGTPTSVPTSTVVPGDVLVLEAGSRVAADARLVTAAHLEMDEASLTGESLPRWGIANRSCSRVPASHPAGAAPSW